MPTTPGIRLVPKRDRRGAILWHVAEGWSRAFGKRATAAEVAHRWQLAPSTCEQVLEELVNRRVVLAHPEGSYELARQE
jgi:DNA-binding IclR family transcriptional regulator